MKSTLIIGGARSGKSRFAQELALKDGGDVLFAATAEAGDDEMKRRIEAHKKVRPPAWRTLEVKTHAGHEIARHIGRAQAVIIDCITLLINNIFQEHEKELEAARLEKEVTAEIDELAESIDNSKAHFIIVTNDVGMGLVPDNKTGRLYRDLLGKANQMLAQHADEVYLMVAGLPVKIKPGR